MFLITEQPLSSVMPAFPYIAFFERIIGKLLPWHWISMYHGSRRKVYYNTYQIMSYHQKKHHFFDSQSQSWFVSSLNSRKIRVIFTALIPRHMGCFGARTLKPTQLFGTAPGPEQSILCEKELSVSRMIGKIYKMKCWWNRISGTSNRIIRIRIS